jgi:hypothetical protein
MHIVFVLFCCLAVVFGLVKYSESPEYKRIQDVREAQEKAAKIPHVIREIDGCKVYKFEDGRDHYFTRCENNTTTESTYACGKSTCTETITTGVNDE